MKYIRTEKGVFEVERLKPGMVTRVVCKGGYETFYTDQHIIKKSNNLKDLCDCFVYDIPNLISKRVPDLMALINDQKTLNARMECLIGEPLLYGLIKTEHGYIYVAKGKDKNSLELMAW